MRIVIAKKLLSSVGGSELQARLLGSALAARGHDVTLIGMRPPWQRPGMPHAAIAGSGGAYTYEDGGIRYVHVPSRMGRIGAVIDGVLPTDLADDTALLEAVRGAEIVHCIAREWAGSLARSARRAGAAFVETPLVHPDQRLSGAGPTDLARYRRDDGVIALTEWEARWYRERGIARVHVTGVGPVLDAIPKMPPDPATVLFVGRKERYKGYHALRAAAPLVWRERGDATFLAIGQAPWYDRFGPRMSDPRWVDLGIVDEPTKARAYARATMLAMPSDHETFGHTYLEAWAAGRPVIAGDIAPLREVVREGIDGIHAANEPRAIARAVLRILADPDEARRMGEAGRARLLERWTWPIVAERTEVAYLAARRWKTTDPLAIVR